MCAAFLAAQPRLMEPVQLVEIHADESVLDRVLRVVEERRGDVHEKNSIEGTSMQRLRAYITLEACIGLTDALREASGMSPSSSSFSPSSSSYSSPS